MKKHKPRLRPYHHQLVHRIQEAGSDRLQGVVMNPDRAKRPTLPELSLMNKRSEVKSRQGCWLSWEGRKVEIGVRSQRREVYWVRKERGKCSKMGHDHSLGYGKGSTTRNCRRWVGILDLALSEHSAHLLFSITITQASLVLALRGQETTSSKTILRSSHFQNLHHYSSVPSVPIR